MGLFGRSEAKHPNFDSIAESLRTHLGLTLAPPSDDVLAALDQMTTRELHNFDNLHSLEGMQELFRARSIRAMIEPTSHTVALFIAVAADLEQEIVKEHAVRPVFHFTGHHATQSIAKPKDAPLLTTTPLPAATLASPAVPLPEGLEHLEAMERLLPQVVDLFLRFGRLNTGDKDVLKKILPTDSSLEARLVALERWQAEVNRRVRNLRVPHATAHVMLGGAETAPQIKPEEALVRRFDAFTIWMSKLIKAFEHTGGVKFHNKPMWLPH